MGVFLGDGVDGLLDHCFANGWKEAGQGEPKFVAMLEHILNQAVRVFGIEEEGVLLILPALGQRRAALEDYELKASVGTGVGCPDQSSRDLHPLVVGEVCGRQIIFDPRIAGAR
jgi:hypothetical protein